MTQNDKTNRQLVLAERPKGAPTKDTLDLVERKIPDAAEGQMLLRTEYLSLDPYMRGRMSDAKSYADPVEIGGVMVGGTVAQVVTSHVDGFAPGDFVLSFNGWQDYAVSDGSGVTKLDQSGAHLSWALGILGMPGFTAWAGLTKIGTPKAGETIVVAAATGPVGATVGQIGKLLGCRVVGIAGGAEKCAYAVDDLGFDACIDHRAAPDAKTLRAQLKEACPNGIDIYFENVGGKTTEAVLPMMNVHGRVPICGMISYYSGAGMDAAQDNFPKAWRTILVNRLKMQGFIISDHWHEYAEFAAEVAPMLKDGSVIYRESIAEGLENAPEAFIQLLKGGNFGKQLVRVKAETA